MGPKTKLFNKMRLLGLNHINQANIYLVECVYRLNSCSFSLMDRCPVLPSRCVSAAVLAVTFGSPANCRKEFKLPVILVEWCHDDGDRESLRSHDLRCLRRALVQLEAIVIVDSEFCWVGGLELDFPLLQDLVRLKVFKAMLKHCGWIVMIYEEAGVNRFLLPGLADNLFLYSVIG